MSIGERNEPERGAPLPQPTPSCTVCSPTRSPTSPPPIGHPGRAGAASHKPNVHRFRGSRRRPSPQAPARWIECLPTRATCRVRLRSAAAAAPRRKGGEDPADCVGSGNGGWGSKGGAASPCQTAMCSTLRRLAYDRYRSHASMTSRRRSSKSVLLYAASTLFPTTWASALSATSRGTPVSEHQSRNELRNP